MDDISLLDEKIRERGRGVGEIDGGKTLIQGRSLQQRTSVFAVPPRPQHFSVGAAVALLELAQRGLTRRN
jgi:hypothetical protein